MSSLTTVKTPIRAEHVDLFKEALRRTMEEMREHFGRGWEPQLVDRPIRLRGYGGVVIPADFAANIPSTFMGGSIGTKTGDADHIAGGHGVGFMVNQEDGTVSFQTDTHAIGGYRGVDKIEHEHFLPPKDDDDEHLKQIKNDVRKTPFGRLWSDVIARYGAYVAGRSRGQSPEEVEATLQWEGDEVGRRRLRMVRNDRVKVLVPIQGPVRPVQAPRTPGAPSSPGSSPGPRQPRTPRHLGL